MGFNDPTTSGGTVDTWEISPSFTNGLSFNPSSGWITGTPTSLQTTAISYTVWANNSGGSISTTINITINDGVPGPFEYIPENNTITNNSASPGTQSSQWEKKMWIFSYILNFGHLCGCCGCWGVSFLTKVGRPLDIPYAFDTARCSAVDGLSR